MILWSGMGRGDTSPAGMSLEGQSHWQEGDGFNIGGLVVVGRTHAGLWRRGSLVSMGGASCGSSSNTSEVLGRKRNHRVLGEGRVVPCP